MWRLTTAAVLYCVLAVVPGCRRTPPPPASTDPVVAPGGSGTRMRPAKTGAVDSLPASSLEARQVDDIAALLQGRVPGLRVIRLASGEISLRIRGSDSIQSDGEPLLIVDGLPISTEGMSFTLRALRPSDIASIDVLKDVSSTAAYGMRGAHGVILITTKHDR